LHSDTVTQGGTVAHEHHTAHSLLTDHTPRRSHEDGSAHHRDHTRIPALTTFTHTEDRASLANCATHSRTPHRHFLSPFALRRLLLFSSSDSNHPSFSSLRQTPTTPPSLLFVRPQLPLISLPFERPNYLLLTSLLHYCGSHSLLSYSPDTESSVSDPIFLLLD
jgi:hypothetical protein